MKKLLMIIPLVILLCFTFSCQDKEAMAELEEMQAQAEVEEQNKEIVRRWIKEINDKNFEILYEELFSPDFQHYVPSNAEPKSYKEYKQIGQQIYSAFHNLTHTIEDMIVKENKVVARVTVKTIHGGEFSGIPATGHELEWSAIAIFELSDGKIKAIWEEIDLLGLYQQLGMELKPKE